MSEYVIKLPIGGYHGGEYGLRGRYEIVSLEEAIKFENYENAEARRKYLDQNGYDGCVVKQIDHLE
jgi:hypothetical protein